MAIRSFFALPLSVESEQALDAFSLQVESELQHNLNPEANIRWVPAVNYHLTLAFLGDIARRDLEPLQQIAADIAENTQPGEFVLQHCEWFPSAVKPRMLVVTPSEYPPLKALQKRLAQSLNRSGFHLEKRPFRPHITLARVKDIAQPLDLGGMQANIHCDMDELVLFSSTLERQGPVYSPLLVEPIQP